MKINKKLQIGVVGSAGSDNYPNKKGGATKMMLLTSEEVGFLLAKKKIIVVTGGKSGIMNSAAKGAKKANGTTIGIVKGKKRFTSNDYTDIEIVSGMDADGFDEVLLVNMCDGLIVIGGGAGTLEEIALAYRNNKPIVVIEGTSGWADMFSEMDYLDERETVKILKAKNASEAVNIIIKAIKYAK